MLQNYLSIETIILIWPLLINCRFLKTMTDFDPIRTVYDHLSGRQPVALMVSYLPEEQTTEMVHV